mgnify:CR=1 FL=1
MNETPLILWIGRDDGPRSMLAEAGFEVTSSESSRPALVLLDLDEPEQPYPEIARVRAQFPDAPVIVLSRHTDPRHVVEAVRSGAQDFVPRDVGPQELRESVDQALLRRRLSLEQRGVVRFLEDRGRQVEDERRLLNERMAALAGELESAHRQLEDAHRELRGRVAQLVMLYRIGRDLTTHRNWDEALQTFLASLCKFLDARGATLLLRSQQGRRLAARSTVGMETAAVDEAIGILRPQRSVDGREPLLSPLTEAGREEPRSCAQMHEPWDRTVLPLWHRDEDLGALVIEKDYASSEAIRDDFYFLITIQTVLTEEVASAQAFSQLRKLQRFQERTLDHLGSGIVTVDADGRIATANAKARELMGLDAIEALPLEARLRLGSEGPSLGQWLSTITDTTPGSVEGRLATEDDAEPIPVSLVASRIPGEFPGDTYHVCVIEDLRQKRALEAERRRAARQKELLIMAAEWAHDVRTPLTGILHSSELLAGAVDPRSPKLRHFRVIQSEVRRINDLVDHFLDYARPVQLRRAAGDLTAIAREVVDLLAGPAAHRGAELRLAVEDGAETCPCELDRDAMKQVTLNLVSNALDAAGEGGRVTVRLARRADAPLDEDGRRGSGVVLRVEDDGPGVPDEFVDRLFVPFFTTKSDGTGLGLAISEKIVRAHDGDLRYLRENGTTILRAIVPVEARYGAAPDGDRDDTDTHDRLRAKG